MELEERIRAKFNELISGGSNLKNGNEHGQALGSEHIHSCKGWLASAQNLVHLVVNNSANPYRATVDTICSSDRGYCIQESVGEVVVILQSLLSDIEHGLLASIENQTKALVFDDFLDHAKEYSKQNMKNESGVIAGVVFEDTLRNICRYNEIEERGVKLDELITELTKQDILTPLKAKRARVAAHVRTKATHAQWDEFDINDVNTAILFTEELINENIT
jgi:hypothetical protein